MKLSASSKRRFKRFLAAAVVTGALAVLAMIICSHTVRSTAEGRTYDRVEDIPHRPVGLVLGTSRKMKDGRDNLFFTYRIQAAARLYKAGKVDRLLVSGDNRTRDYNETRDMRDALVRAGVPQDRIAADYAGLRTLDSVVRAREVFGQSHITVISQRFHNERALYIASHRGIDAVGFNAADVGDLHGFRIWLRERLARVRVVLDILVLRTRPRFSGPPEPLPPLSHHPLP